MPERLVFDDRLLNRYAVEHLQAGYPALHTALGAWFAAFGDLDTSSLEKLLGARSPADVDKWKGPAQAALAVIPPVVETLDGVIAALELALAAAPAEREQLEGLLASARGNRVTLVEQVPALVGRVLGSAGTYHSARAEADATATRTIERLEAMRARSTEESRTYRELQPMVAELRSVWAALDRALEPLSREDRRAVRSPHDARMREAATALCRNLFQRKMRDRATGAWPGPELPPPGEGPVERFADALARGDHAGANALLAPWLATAWPAQRLGEEIGRRMREAADEFAQTEPPPAGGLVVGSNPMRYEDVRQDRRLGPAVPVEVTGANYVGWFSVQLQTEEEDGYLTDLDTLMSLYVIAVTTPEGERIGHLEFME
jgi:hypothetical protein